LKAALAVDGTRTETSLSGRYTDHAAGQRHLGALGCRKSHTECGPPDLNPGGRCWSSRKPSSVPVACAAGMVICLGWPSPATSSSLPAASLSGWSVRTAPRRLFGLAPTGGCRAAAVTSDAVGSYPTFSPLPPTALRPAGAVRFLWPCPSPCGAQALPGSLSSGARTFLERLSTPATNPLGQREECSAAPSYRLSARSMTDSR